MRVTLGAHGDKWCELAGNSLELGCVANLDWLELTTHAELWNAKHQIRQCPWLLTCALRRSEQGD
ncbi:hypothetical protein TIFTF001_005571 [Ficus carica]|uniref:Uncharacterized protein n=1 Tax=Ficus carica TaxID=3494 RepID=A0AA88CUY1_FICCA|nr:hypothetical protein TIFTF001_005571 [Ficus carica]